jgi:hypothetical protein
VQQVIQPVTHAVVTVTGAALGVAGVLVWVPPSAPPVPDVITAVENILISVNDAVLPLAQVPSDLYSLLVVAGMGATPVSTVGSSFAAGLPPAPGVLESPIVPASPPVLPVPPASDIPLLGHVTAPATLGGVAAAGLTANRSLSGMAPIAVDADRRPSALSLLENTVNAMLAPASLSALAAFALPGVAGLVIICAAGVRFGYRQAKAALLVRTTGISRFARQGPLGVVRSGVLVAVHSRQPRSVRGTQPKVSAAAPLFEQAA